MKVYLIKDVVNVGMAGEIIKVSDGFGINYLVAKKLGIQITEKNAHFYENKKKTVEHRKEVVATETSMLAERINAIAVTLKRKMHNNKLYGSVAAHEVTDLLAEKGIKVAKNQVVFDKAIKEKGSYEITIKLSSRLQPKIKLMVVSEEI